MTAPTETMADRVLQLVKDKGWSHATLVERAGLGKSAVTDLVNKPEKKTRAATVQAFADALGVSTAYLLGRVEGKTRRTLLRAGFNWENSPPDLSVSKLSQGIVSMVESGPGELEAFTLCETIAALGMVEGTTVIVDKMQHPKTGEIVLIRDLSGGIFPCYLFEPYLVELGAKIAPKYSIKDSNIEIIGRVVFTLNSEITC